MPQRGGCADLRPWAAQIRDLGPRCLGPVLIEVLRVAERGAAPLTELGPLVPATPGHTWNAGGRVASLRLWLLLRDAILVTGQNDGGSDLKTSGTD